ncbi:hypothetical protein [Flavobacterium sp. SM2513]|uniref:hypothetical protein n=1 Tax=Flavobacterium sp. SM2513 TaxID=3424766 RepID=UPI003D7F3644
MKIPQEPIPYTYQESKRIFENKLSAKEGAENIHTKCGIKFLLQVKTMSIILGI